jgi:hypothetical protein
MHPAVEGHLVDLDAPLGKQLLRVPVPSPNRRYQRTASTITSAGKPSRRRHTPMLFCACPRTTPGGHLIVSSAVVREQDAPTPTQLPIKTQAPLIRLLEASYCLPVVLVTASVELPCHGLSTFEIVDVDTPARRISMRPLASEPSTFWVAVATRRWSVDGRSAAPARTEPSAPRGKGSGSRGIRRGW